MTDDSTIVETENVGESTMVLVMVNFDSIENGPGDEENTAEELKLEPVSGGPDS